MHAKCLHYEYNFAILHSQEVIFEQLEHTQIERTTIKKLYRE